MARAIAPRPRLLLLDEPFAALDPNLRAQVRGELVALLRATETPAVFVSHDQAEAMALGDRLAVMRAGGSSRSAPVRTSTTGRPTGSWPAFMGDATFLPVTSAATGDAPSSGRLRWPDAGGGRRRGPSGRRRAHRRRRRFGEVIATEYVGPTWTYDVRLASGAVVRSSRSHLVRLAVGATAHVSLVPGHRLVAVADDER